MIVSWRLSTFVPTWCFPRLVAPWRCTPGIVAIGALPEVEETISSSSTVMMHRGLLKQTHTLFHIDMRWIKSQIQYIILTVYQRLGSTRYIFLIGWNIFHTPLISPMLWSQDGKTGIQRTKKKKTPGSQWSCRLWAVPLPTFARLAVKAARTAWVASCWKVPK